MLISERYTDDLKLLKYGQGYDIRIHAIQTTLLILDPIYFDKINTNDLNFGYYCSSTESIITEFQKYNKLVSDGKLTLETWNSIFSQLKILKNCSVIQTGPKSIDIIGANELLEGNNINSSNNSKVPTLSDNEDNISSDVILSIASDNLAYEENTSGKSYLSNINNFSSNLKNNSLLYYQYNNLSGGKTFDDLAYNYIVSGGRVYNNASYSYNLTGSESWDYKYITPIMFNSTGGENKDYDYIYNLLANSVYDGNINLSPMAVSFSNNDIGKYLGPLGKSTNKTYFSPYAENKFKNDALKNSKFDITIVYGPKGSKARKIIEVTPMAMSQEVNASGEPIYDIYEFIAKDVVDGI